MQDIFRTFVATILARVNTLTGVTYRSAVARRSPSQSHALCCCSVPAHGTTGASLLLRADALAAMMTTSRSTASSGLAQTKYAPPPYL